MNSNNLEILNFVNNDENNENFNTALNIYDNHYEHDDLIDMLKNGCTTEKQISVLKLEKITSESDASILVSNLTGQDGKVREAVSFKLNEFAQNSEFNKYFYSKNNYDIFMNAIIDINGNICRNTISAICTFIDNQEFCNYFCPKLTKLTLELVEKVKDFDIQEGKYKINKEVFKLYWCLETIYEFYNKVDFSILKDILLKTKIIDDYTIREKTAKILTRNFNDSDLIKAQEELRQDKNYYVRRF